VSTEPFSRAFLIAQARRRPGWEAADLYKLLHQATRGSEHAAPSAASARERLERESAEMGPGPAHSLVEPIRADGALARVHLRPWLAAGLDRAVLLEAFLATAGAWREVPGELEEALRRAADWAADLGLAADAVVALAGRMQEQGYPPVHHSAAYRLRYRPAYRVVAPRLLPAGLLAGPEPEAER